MIKFWIAKTIFILLFILLSSLSFAKQEHNNLLTYKFSFSRFNGNIDKNSAQRGLQIYIELCSTCHSMNQLSYRNLLDLGYSEDQVKIIASQFEVDSAPDEYGEVKKRKALLSDKFSDPYPNKEAAKSANNGAFPPDLSLIIKARKGGANYLRSLLLGYSDIPEGFESENGYYNKYYTGNIIAMPQPLYGDDVEYQDGVIPTLEQEVIDIVTFLTWASMPELEDRRKSGIRSVLFLVIMTIMFYFSYKKIWSKLNKEG